MAGSAVVTAGFFTEADWKAVSGALIALGTTVYAALYKQPAK